MILWDFRAARKLCLFAWQANRARVWGVLAWRLAAADQKLSIAAAFDSVLVAEHQAVTVSRLPFPVARMRDPG